MTQFSALDHQHMARALQLARRGLYSTQPNPRVGCVLVKNGAVIGAGWHERAGGPHAEIQALRAVAGDVSGACAYVSLEPCAHHGRTPPCAQALVDAKVARVVAATLDANPLVAGRGLEILRKAGISVASGLCAAQAVELNVGFLSRMGKQRPWVRCKMGMSLDGRTAMASGESKWITGAGARADVQRLRARSCALLTGIGTVLADDPSLTARISAASLPPEYTYIDRQPHRIVLDTTLRFPVHAKMLSLPGTTTVVTASQDQVKRAALLDAGAQVVCLPDAHGKIDLLALRGWLVEQQINELLVEAGARISGALLRAGWIDELVVYMAPLVMGDQAKGLFSLPGLETLSQRINLKLQQVRQVGDDLRLTYVPHVTDH